MIKNSGWEQYEAIKTAELFKENKTYDLVDLGANQALFTVQLLKLINTSEDTKISISNVMLYEADSRLIPLMDKNLRSNLSSEININIQNIAISLKKGEVELILEKENTANNTLEPSAMANATSDEIRVKIKSINAIEFEEATSKYCPNPLIYKSDIQGTDVPFFLSLSDNMISKIEIIIIEFWPYVLKSNSVKIPTFIDRLKTFNEFFIYNSKGSLVSENIDDLNTLCLTNSSTDYFNIIGRR